MRLKSLIGFVLLAVTVSAGSLFAANNVFMRNLWTITPDSPVAGTTVTISNYVRNEADGLSNFIVECGVDGMKVTDVVIPSLGTNRQQLVTFTWTAVSGTHEVYMKVDPANVIVETNEGDNMSTKTIQVTSTTMPPDLHWNISVSVNPPSPYANTNAAISANFCLNTGTVTNLKVKASIDGSQIWENTYATFDHGCSNINFNWLAVEGSHQISIILDPDNTILEQYENNNETTRQLNVQPPLAAEHNGPGDPYWDTTFATSGWQYQPKATGLTPGASVRISAKMRYTGSQMDNLKIKCGTDTVVLFDGGFTALTEGTERTIAFDYKTPLVSGAKLKVHCQIDPDQIRNDTNRANNYIETEVETVTLIPQTELGTSTVLENMGPCGIATLPTDLAITTFNQADSSAEKVKFIFTVKNNGQGCVSKFQWRANDETGSLLADGWVMKSNITKPNQLGGTKPDQWLLKQGESKVVTGYIKKSDIKSNCYRPTENDVNIICPKIKFAIDPNNLGNDPDRTNNERIVTLKFYTPR